MRPSVVPPNISIIYLVVYRDCSYVGKDTTFIRDHQKFPLYFELFGAEQIQAQAEAEIHIQRTVPIKGGNATAVREIVANAWLCVDAELRKDAVFQTGSSVDRVPTDMPSNRAIS